MPLLQMDGVSQHVSSYRYIHVHVIYKYINYYSCYNYISHQIYIMFVVFSLCYLSEVTEWFLHWVSSIPHEKLCSRIDRQMLAGSTTNKTGSIHSEVHSTIHTLLCCCVWNGTWPR